MVRPWTLDEELLRVVLDPLGVNEAPSVEVMRSLLDEAFAASLMREEGRSVVFSLAAFGVANTDIAFAQPIAFVAENLRRLAPVLSSRSEFLSVRVADGGDLALTGVLRAYDLGPGLRSVPDGILVSVLGPGHMIVAFRGQELVEIGPSGWWRSGGIARDLAVYKLIDGALDLDRKGEPRSVQAVGLLWVARGMQRHGHGGSLLVLSAGSPDGLEMKFPVAQGSSRLQDAVAEAQGAAESFDESITSLEWSRREWTKGLPYKLAETVANLSAVDGAVVMMADLTILGFGAFMGFGGAPPADIREYALVSEAGDCRPQQMRILNAMSEAGGARHQAALRFAHRHAGRSVAFVASQDGGLSIVIGCTDGTVAIVRCG